ncbi:MAG TPA: 5'-nucleotidase C-terminal domain-containing protein [Patescibacteria group bacterium]|nr:5'-nucleotidase C-terminal domain-containing protein [Patescibacteria group bacterium]
MSTWAKKIAGLLVALVWMAALVPGAAASADTGGDSVFLEIYSINDFHGALTAGGKNPGAAKLAQYLKECKQADPQGSFVFSGGDMFQGTPESNMLYGKTVVAMMNEIGFDAMTLGNHEFDWGLDVLKERIQQSKFPVIAANVLDKTTGKPFALVKPYVLLKKQGVTVGVIGMATPETAYKASPRLLAGLEFADPARIVEQLLPELKAQGADIIVVLSHLGSHQDKGEVGGEAAELAKSVSGVDLIISAHEHRLVAGEVNRIPVVQAGYNGRAVAKTTLEYSPAQKKVIDAKMAIIELPFDGLTQDAAVQKLVEQAEQELAPVKNVVLGNTVNGLEHDRSRLSVLGQWATDAMRQASQADIAFLNGGGLRTGIAAGNITMGKLYEVSPFDDTLITLDLTGEQIKAVLEYGIRNANIGMVQFSGLQVNYDASLPQGQRVTAMILSSGMKLAAEKKYRVCINNFMTEGGDGFTMFKSGTHIIDTFIPVRDAFRDAVKKAGVIDFDGDQRLLEEHGPGMEQKPAA